MFVASLRIIAIMTSGPPYLQVTYSTSLSKLMIKREIVPIKSKTTEKHMAYKQKKRVESESEGKKRNSHCLGGQPTIRRDIT